MKKSWNALRFVATVLISEAPIAASGCFFGMSEQFTVAPRLRGICASGAPAGGSAGCGLDRQPDTAQALRSRGARLLPLLRETTRAATGAGTWLPRHDGVASVPRRRRTPRETGSR